MTGILGCVYLNSATAFFFEEKKIGNYIKAELPVLRDSLLKQKLWLITEDNMASEYKSTVWSRITKFKPDKY